MIQGWRRWPTVIPKQMFIYASEWRLQWESPCTKNQQIYLVRGFKYELFSQRWWSPMTSFNFQGLNFTHQPVEVWSNVFLGFLFVVSRFWYPDLDIFKYIFWSKTGDIEGNIQEAQKGETKKNLWLSGWFQSHSCFISRVLPFCGGFCLVTSKTTMVSVKQKVLIADTWAVFKCSKTLLVDDYRGLYYPICWGW